MIVFMFLLIIIFMICIETVFLLGYALTQFVWFKDLYSLRLFFIAFFSTPFGVTASLVIIARYLSFMPFSLETYIISYYFSYIGLFIGMIIIAMVYLNRKYPFIIQINALLALIFASIIITIVALNIFSTNNYEWLQVQANTLLIEVHLALKILIIGFIISISLTTIMHLYLVHPNLGFDRMKRKNRDIFYLLLFLLITTSFILLSIKSKIYLYEILIVQFFFQSIIFFVTYMSYTNPLQLLLFGCSPIIPMKKGYITYAMISMNDPVLPPCYHASNSTDQVQQYQIQDETVLIRLSHLLYTSYDLMKIQKGFTFLLTHVDENPNIMALLLSLGLQANSSSSLLSSQENFSPKKKQDNNDLQEYSLKPATTGLILFIPRTLIPFISSLHRINDLVEKYTFLFYQDMNEQEQYCETNRKEWERFINDLLMKLF